MDNQPEKPRPGYPRRTRPQSRADALRDAPMTSARSF